MLSSASVPFRCPVPRRRVQLPGGLWLSRTRESADALGSLPGKVPRATEAERRVAPAAEYGCVAASWLTAELRSSRVESRQGMKRFLAGRRGWALPTPLGSARCPEGQRASRLLSLCRLRGGRGVGRRPADDATDDEDRGGGSQPRLEPACARLQELGSLWAARRGLAKPWLTTLNQCTQAFLPAGGAEDFYSLSPGLAAFTLKTLVSPRGIKWLREGI